jgi:alkylhydroperoxidase family enzyme
MTVRQQSRLDGDLKDLALLAVAAGTGCSWCTGAGYWAPAGRRQVIEAEIRATPRWRDGEVFTRLERLVMLYAEATAMSPPMATDDLTADLRERLGEPGLAELTAIIAAALGRPQERSQGPPRGQTRQSGLD